VPKFVTQTGSFKRALTGEAACGQRPLRKTGGLNFRPQAGKIKNTPVFQWLRL
jgi:hypothetical protein